MGSSEEMQLANGELLGIVAELRSRLREVEAERDALRERLAVEE